ncbi:hypothetical protein HYW30_01680 [Candidatus Azambacteria bacterium]|nr:hypothetical protein [Candidatus Azambacteria bacterium]MBI2587988.1 hypothetical protein [Candidatus Azambacteria bacterium]
MTEGNLVSTKEAAQALGYAPDYVGYLARTGKIFAKRIGRDWFTNLEAVRAHKEGGPRVEPVPIRVEKPASTFRQLAEGQSAVILTATAERQELERLRQEVKVLRRLLRYREEPRSRSFNSPPPAEELQRFQPGWRRQHLFAPTPRRYELRRAGLALIGFSILLVVSLQPAVGANLRQLLGDVRESLAPQAIEARKEANILQIFASSLAGIWDEFRVRVFK